MHNFAGIAVLLGTATAQLVFLDVPYASNLTQCNSQQNNIQPHYQHKSFFFTQNTTRRTATPIASPTTTTTYAPPYAQLSTLLPSILTTTWGSWRPDDLQATDTAEPYGRAAWSSLWEEASLVNFTTGIYSATVSPTPVPTSELVLPPSDPFVPQDCYTFPEDFVMGIAGSAIQIEGATADQGRGPSFGDKFVGPEFVLEMTGQTPESRDHSYITNENYYLYKQDITRLAAMGVPYYSFSIAWTRILPFVLPGTPLNAEGLQHYDDLINFILEKGMKPVVTLTHIDSPLVFYSNKSTSYVSRKNTYGFLDYGMQDPRFEDAWVNYGKIVMSHFADRVPIWVTINEPVTGIDKGASVYTVLKGHARLSHFYHDEIKGKGKIAAQQYSNAEVGIFANALFLGQDYPDIFKLSLPDYVPLSAEDLEYMNGTADYFAVDAYTATIISSSPGGIQECARNQSDPLFPSCVLTSTVDSNGWQFGYRSQAGAYTTPSYLRTSLNWIWNTYKAPIIVSEFGFPVNGETSLPLQEARYDSPRSEYYLSYMQAMLQAIWEDNVHVLGAFAWSFADNWEFGDFSTAYGLQVINRTSQERHYKKSFFDLMDYYNSRKACKD
ncbi:hypothetical protein D0868_00476 [Hortaea werneckii]|uniref:Beta-glucosidase n=1 Tax=Hortaea werneckii TaxID=91943 RepID=A0A3M6ZM22_HORWE|nr:hypothetical protein D0868_00476 [Hortaea werneckii]